MAPQQEGRKLYLSAGMGAGEADYGCLKSRFPTPQNNRAVDPQWGPSMEPSIKTQRSVAEEAHQVV